MMPRSREELGSCLKHSTYIKCGEQKESSDGIIPMLRNVYSEQTGYKLGMFYLEGATTELLSMMGIEGKIEF